MDKKTFTLSLSKKEADTLIAYLDWATEDRPGGGGRSPGDKIIYEIMDRLAAMLLGEEE